MEQVAFIKAQKKLGERSLSSLGLFIQKCVVVVVVLLECRFSAVILKQATLTVGQSD